MYGESVMNIGWLITFLRQKDSRHNGVTPVTHLPKTSKPQFQAKKSWPHILVTEKDSFDRVSASRELIQLNTMK